MAIAHTSVYLHCSQRGVGVTAAQAFAEAMVPIDPVVNWLPWCWVGCVEPTTYAQALVVAGTSGSEFGEHPRGDRTFCSRASDCSVHMALRHTTQRPSSHLTSSQIGTCLLSQLIKLNSDSLDNIFKWSQIEVMPQLPKTCIEIVSESQCFGGLNTSS